MITGLLILALLLTALLALSLPFGGWSPGMDAAGQGMAMFFPVIFMAVRITSFGVAIALVAARGEFDWTGLPAVAAALVALALLGGMGASSIVAASLLVEAPRTYGRGSYAFLAVVVAPIVLTIWLFAESYDADPAQTWVIRGLVLLAAIGPLPLLLAIQRHKARMREIAVRQEQAEDAAAHAYAARLPPDASFEEALRFYDSIPDEQWKSRDIVFPRLKAIPGAEGSFERLLSSDNWDTRILAAFHASAISPPASPAYFEAARQIVEEVVRHLEDDARSPESLVRETAAAVRVAWPAIHTESMSKALMERFLAAIENRGPETDLNNYVHDVKMLALYVNG